MLLPININSYCKRTITDTNISIDDPCAYLTTYTVDQILWSNISDNTHRHESMIEYSLCRRPFPEVRIQHCLNQVKHCFRTIGKRQESPCDKIKNNEIAAHHIRKHKLAAQSRACGGLMQTNTKLGRTLRHWIIGKYKSREEEVHQSFYIYVSFLLERE